MKAPLASLALAFLVAGATLPATAADAPIVVHIKDFKYNPNPLHVHVGQTVSFINNDDEPHTVTEKNKKFDSEALDTNGAWKYTFKKAGTYAYFCELHPYMKASVVVTPMSAAAAKK